MLKNGGWRKTIVLLLIFLAAGAAGAFSRPGDQLDNRLSPRPPRTDFRANWIWVPASAGYEGRNSYAYFRKTFEAPGPLIIDIAADNVYQLFLDGRALDRGTAPSEISYKTYDTIKIPAGPGRHVLAVLVHHVGQVCATSMRSRPGLFVEVTAASGEKIISDATWKTTPALAYRQFLPVMMSHFGFYEVCDTRQVPDGWETPGFDDREWPSAEVIGPAGCAPWVRLIPRDIPRLASALVEARALVSRGSYQAGPLNETEEDITVAVEMAARRRVKAPAERLQWPVRLAAGKEHEFVIVDFGREVTGHLRLSLSAARAGQKIDIGYDETLDRDGLPNPRRTYVHFADRYYLKDNQPEIDVFGARGFRYLLIDAAAGLGGLTLSGARVEERTYPVPAAGTFRSSDEALEKLYRVGLLTTRLCMLDTYVDCPSRERVMWMDLAVEAPCSVYGYGITDLWRKGLFLLAQNTSTTGVLNGAIKGFAPCDYDPMLVSYTMGYVNSVCDYYLHSGDRAAAEALFPTVMKQFEIISQFLTPEGLVNEKWPGWGTYLDWSAMDIGGVSSCNNAIYLRMHKKMAVLARLLGKADVASNLEKRSEEIEKAYRKAFWREKEGLFIDSVYDGQPSPVRSQLANVMAVWSGAVKGEPARALLRRILDPAKLLPRTSGDYRLKPGFKPMTGGIVPIGTPGSGFLMVQALFETGLAGEALAYLKDNWIPLGAGGTFAEHFSLDANTSFCHGWGAGPTAQLPAYVLGIQPAAPGWREIRIVPQAGNLEWAEGTVPTPLGEIHVAWKKTVGKLQISYNVPPGIKVVS